MVFTFARRSWHWRLAALIVAIVVLGGCGALTPMTTPGPAPTPVVVVSSVVPTEASATSPSRTASSTSTPEPTPEPTATASASVDLCTVPSSLASYYCATKNAEGAHGGPPVLDLASAIAIDYWVRGTCPFSLGLSNETSAAGLPSVTMNVSGTVAGTWRASIKPGHYVPLISEAVGCVYSVNVRADR
jgi:hypothetical protein